MHTPAHPCAVPCAVLLPEQVQELELSVDLRSLDKLLDFLSCSFMGGTDVDKPLQLSLERLQKDEWQQVCRLLNNARKHLQAGYCTSSTD